MSRRRLSLTALSLLALALGLGLGALANGLRVPWLLAGAVKLGPLGNLWVDVLKVTVVPLVLVNLLLGVAGAGGGGTAGRMGALSFAWFVGLLVATGLLTWLAMPPLMAALPLAGLSLGPAGAEATRAALPAAGAAGISPYGWLVGLVPTDPLGAAARGEILPLIVLTLAFAIALAHVTPAARRPVLDLARAVSEAVNVVLRWILALMPPAVFCLTCALAARTGTASVGAIGLFVALLIGLLVLFTLLLYPLTAAVARVPLGRFARAAAPAQIVAVGSRSSLVSLPGMVLGMGRDLGLPAAVTGFVLPLSVATFKLNRTVSSVARLLFLARLYGVPLEPAQVAGFIGAIVLISFGTPGVPSTGSTLSLPFYLAMGIPLDGVVILGAVDAVPDVFKTLLNVTGDMSVAAIVARQAGPAAADPPSAVIAPAAAHPPSAGTRPA